MSNERSPRDVCSITIGINGLMQAPCCRGSTTSSRPRAPPARASRSVRARPPARSRSASPLPPGGRARRAAADPRAGARARRAPRALDHLVGIVALLDLLADERLHVVVGDDDVASRRRAPRARARARPRARASAWNAAWSCSGVRPVMARYVSAMDAAPLRASARSRESSSAVRASTSGAAGWTRESSDERVDRGGAECVVGLVLELLAHALFDVGAQLGDRVELARRARQVVVDGRQHLLLQLLQRDRDRAARVVARARRPTSRDSPGESPTSARSTSSTRRPEPTSTTVSRWPSPEGGEQVDHGRVAFRAGRPSAGTSSATSPRSASTACSIASSGTSTSSARHLELAPVDELGLRLHVDRGAERPVLVVGRRAARSRSSAGRPGAGASGPQRSRTSRRCGCRPPPCRCARGRGA